MSQPKFTGLSQGQKQILLLQKQAMGKSKKKKPKKSKYYQPTQGF